MVPPFGDSPIQAQIAIPMEHAPNYVATQNLVCEARRGIIASRAVPAPLLAVSTANVQPCPSPLW